MSHTTTDPAPGPDASPRADAERAGITARATVVAERRGARTALTTLRSEPPLTLRPTPDALYLVGSAAGPLGGDDLALDVTVADGARLTFRTVAASIVLPGPHGARSRTVTTVTVGAGASLRFLPEPVIAVERCDHVAETIITLAAGATLLWREQLVLGRHGEGPGSIRQRIRVDRAGEPLYRNELAVGPAHPGWNTPAVLGSCRSVTTTLTVGPAGDRVPDGDPACSATMALAPDVTLTLSVR
ncbi:MAG: urease accessory protein UreD [Acidimicrobiales bacterium]|nr:urease accessory protein UreD [Acidimicrobiales bacterium]